MLNPQILYFLAKNKKEGGQFTYLRNKLKELNIHTPLVETRTFWYDLDKNGNAKNGDFTLEDLLTNALHQKQAEEYLFYTTPPELSGRLPAPHQLVNEKD